MKINDINIIAPSVFNEPFSEAEVLGAMVLQWANHEYYKQISIDSMLDLVIPIIKSKQFALFSKNHQPIGYVVWALMDEKTEQEYIQCGGEIDRFVGCHNGENLWILSLFAEQGYTAEVVSLIKNRLFSTRYARSLYHQGKERGLKIMHFYGANYSGQKSHIPSSILKGAW